MVSIIVPAFNQAQYIRQAIESVINQTYSQFDLIIVDDGSTDETPEILSAVRDARIRVIRQSNMGLSAARNRGLHESSAPFVSFLDADDVFQSDKLEVLTQYLDQHPDVGMVAGATLYIDQNGKHISEQTQMPCSLSLPNLLFQNPICVSGILLRREWLDRVGTFDENLRACEDWDLWLRLLRAGCRMEWIDHVVVKYRIHSGQMTKQSARMKNATLSMLDKFFGKEDVPSDLVAQKELAYAAAYLHAAVFAYLSGELNQAATDLDEAIHLDPSFRDKGYSKLVNMLVGWSCDPRVTEPVDFLRVVYSNLPGGQPGLGMRIRRAVADELLSHLYHGSVKTWRDHKWELTRALAYRPELLVNRGVMRMAIGAWLGI